MCYARDEIQSFASSGWVAYFCFVRRRMKWLCVFLAATLVVISASQSEADSLKRSRINTAVREWISTDPAFLYLKFIDRSDPSELSITSLHPISSRSSTYQESFMRGHQQESHAFTLRLARQTPSGYEVVFHPADPLTLKPLSTKAIRCLFPRATHGRLQLTDRVSVVGFYGNPQHEIP